MTAVRPRRVAVSPGRYRQITGFALVALVVIVVSGAAVRLTGSGLGCPSWPHCEPGRLTPHDATDHHAMIEYVNRLFTGVVSVAVALAVLGSRFRTPRRRDLTAWSWSLVAGVVAQILLGALTVRYELAPPFVMGHFLVSAVLVLCATVLHHRAGLPDDGPMRRDATEQVSLLSRVIVGAAGVVLVTGTAVTGAGPHSGDEDVARLEIAVPDAARFHAIVVWVLVAATVWALVLVRRGGAGRGVEVALWSLVVVETAQGAVGYTQYFSGVPAGLVAVHVLGSTLVWIAAIRVLLATRVPADGSPEPGSPGPGSGDTTAGGDDDADTDTDTGSSPDPVLPTSGLPASGLPSSGLPS